MESPATRAWRNKRSTEKYCHWAGLSNCHALGPSALAADKDRLAALAYRCVQAAKPRPPLSPSCQPSAYAALVGLSKAGAPYTRVPTVMALVPGCRAMPATSQADVAVSVPCWPVAAFVQTKSLAWPLSTTPCRTREDAAPASCHSQTGLVIATASAGAQSWK